MNNILVVNVNWLGDAIFSTPVFKALKQAYPNAKITCMCPPRVKEVLEHCPYIDHIMIYDEKRKHRWPWKKIKLIFQMRKAGFDGAFLLHRSMTRAWLVFCAGIPKRIGASKSRHLLTQWLDIPQGRWHRSDEYLKVIEGYGISVYDRTCELTIKTKDFDAINAKLKDKGINEHDPYIIINAGGNWNLKRWPSGLFAILAKRIVGDFKIKVVLSGASSDKDNCTNIVQQAGVPIVSMAGETSLGESLALYRRAKVVISNDTGPLHLANAVGASVVGLFGPTRPEITGPRGIGPSKILFNQIACNHSACYHQSCRNNVCMQTITVDHVCQALKDIVR